MQCTRTRDYSAIENTTIDEGFGHCLTWIAPSALAHETTTEEQMVCRHLFVINSGLTIVVNAHF